MNWHKRSSPKASFAPLEQYNRNISSYLSLLTDEMLWKDMEDAADIEDYESAICYRNELIKRGKLKISEPT